MSYCVRRKVGAIVLREGAEISHGFNGTVSGFPNVCELPDGTTNQETIHAEVNALSKCLQAGVSVKGCEIWITLSPCIDCAKLIVQSGITCVRYIEDYRDNSGLLLLKKAGIKIEKL